MTGLERTTDFINHKKTDRPPLHPILMLWAAKYSCIPYSEFVLNAPSKAKAMIKAADDFGLDWCTVMSDPYCEAEGFGLPVTYPFDDLPKHTDYLIKDMNDINRLKPLNPYENRRTLNRIKEVEELYKYAGDRYFIVGWAEGSLAEYADLRGLAEMCLDFYDYEKEMNTALDIILETSIEEAKAEIKAGAHCIGIGDAVCSQIGPKFYREFGFEREKILIDAIHSEGAYAKLHICGDTTKILPDMIKTGADIIDVDHLVSDMSTFVPLLGDTQVLCGNSDPVEIVYRGNEEEMKKSMLLCHRQTQGLGITSAGCEIPPNTSLETFRTYCNLAHTLFNN